MFLNNFEGFMSPKKTLLIIEDSHYDYLLLKNIISAKYGDNLNILYASCLEDAYAIFKSNNYDYDFILLDLNLPDGFGINTIHEVRRLHGETPILAITGMKTDTMRHNAQNMGADILISKDNLLHPSFLNSIDTALKINVAAA